MRCSRKKCVDGNFTNIARVVCPTCILSEIEAKEAIDKNIADNIQGLRKLGALKEFDKVIESNKIKRVDYDAPEGIREERIRELESEQKPGGTIIGNVYFICAVSKAQVAITMRQEGTKIHMTTSHRGVAQHTPVIEMYSKLMNVLKEEK